MSSHPIHALQGVRLDDLLAKATRLQAVRDQIQSDLEARQSEIAVLTRRQETLTKVTELYRVLMDSMIMGQVQTIEKVINEGIRTIFYDQDLTFMAEVGTSRGKISVDFFLAKGDPERGGFKGSLMESFGGGPASVTSLLLRILTLLRLKRRKLLILDETLGAVSDDYIEGTGTLLRKLAETSGLDILLVTHKAAFLDHAKVSYQGEQRAGTDGLDEVVIKRLRREAA